MVNSMLVKPENSSTTSYKEQAMNANDTLTMKSGKDTDLISGTVSGNKVKADVYGNQTSMKVCR